MKRTGNSELKKIIGKTIKECSVTEHEASDSCFYIVVELNFTDSSMFSFMLRNKPEVHGIFFKNDDDSPKYSDINLVS